MFGGDDNKQRNFIIAVVVLVVIIVLVLMYRNGGASNAASSDVSNAASSDVSSSSLAALNSSLVASDSAVIPAVAPDGSDVLVSVPADNAVAPSTPSSVSSSGETTLVAAVSPTGANILVPRTDVAVEPSSSTVNVTLTDGSSVNVPALSVTPTSSSVSVSSPYSWNFVQGKWAASNYGNEIIAVRPSPSVEDAKALCIADSRCNSFIYNPNDWAQLSTQAVPADLDISPMLTGVDRNDPLAGTYYLTRS